MICVVTGAKGFIGSHLVEELSKQHTVISIDTKYNREEECSTIYRGILPVNFHKILDEFGKIDIIFHLASVVGVDDVSEAPYECIISNVNNGMNVADISRAHNIPVIFTSTSEVYGEIKEALTEESTLVVKSTEVPRWSYATSKLLLESLFFSAHKSSRVVRLFNIVGENQRTSASVLPKFIHMVKHGMIPTIYNNGKQTRSFCYVKDIIPSFLSLANQIYKEDLPKVFNLGNDEEEITVYDLALKIMRKNESLSGVFMAHCIPSLSVPDISRRKPDISLAKKYLGLNPTTSLEEIIDILWEVTE